MILRGFRAKKYDQEWGLRGGHPGAVVLELQGNRWCKALKTDRRRQEGPGRGRAHEASENTEARGAQGPGWARLEVLL